MIGSNGAAREQMLIELLRLFEIAELQRNMYEEYEARLAEQAAGPVSRNGRAVPRLLPREKAVLEITYSSVFGE